MEEAETGRNEVRSEACAALAEGLLVLALPVPQLPPGQVASPAGLSISVCGTRVLAASQGCHKCGGTQALHGVS